MTEQTGTMHGKTVLITGGTAGIGKAVAIGLARLGATVVVTGRDKTRSDGAVKEIIAASGNTSVSVLGGDVSTEAGVRQLAADFLAQHDTLHVLLNNAGVLMGRRELTADGVETLFAVHNLAPFLLSHLLLDVLKASARPGATARILNTNSGQHRQGKIDLSDLNAERSFKPMPTYGTAKLASLMTTYEFARRLQGTNVTINAVDPGPVNTDMLRTAPIPQPLKSILPIFARVAASTPEKAAERFIYVASSPALEGVSGKYFTAKPEAVPSSQASYDEATARRLWAESERLTHLTPAEALIA